MRVIWLKCWWSGEDLLVGVSGFKVMVICVLAYFGLRLVRLVFVVDRSVDFVRGVI